MSSPLYIFLYVALDEKGLDTPELDVPFHHKGYFFVYFMVINMRPHPTDIPVSLSSEYLGEGAVTEPLESEKGEGGTLPSLGRKYFRYMSTSTK